MTRVTVIALSAAATKKATLLEFDRVLGFRLAEWKPAEETLPDKVMALVQQREEARAQKHRKEADALRGKVSQAGYEIEDTPQGPRLRLRKSRPKVEN